MITITAGNMNRRIEILERSITSNELSEVVTTWNPIGKVWACVDGLNGREFFMGERRNSEVTHKIKIRYRKGITSQHRVRLGHRIFDIAFIINTEEANVELVLVAKETH